MEQLKSKQVVLEATINIKYEYTSDISTAKQWLEALESTFAADFEVAIKYTPEELEEFKNKMEDESLPYLERKQYGAKCKATALGHPSHTKITHLSIADSIDFGRVIILDSPEITKLVLEFLVTTDKKQVWHNASFDFKHIEFYLMEFPKNYEDTQILYKTLLNHTDILKAKTGLKTLAGSKYGSWAIASDNFTLASMYDEGLLKYAAVDACATYYLWDEWSKLQKGWKDNDGGFNN